MVHMNGPGTNTLVNTNTSGTAGAKESGGSTASTKPASAAAGLASLVPSKGAPVAAARPSLKPGEYPPTAELQVSRSDRLSDVQVARRGVRQRKHVKLLSTRLDSSSWPWLSNEKCSVLCHFVVRPVSKHSGNSQGAP